MDSTGENRRDSVAADTLCWPYGLSYLEGRLALAAGNIDDAIGAFETLVADGTEAAEAWLGMALCLAMIAACGEQATESTDSAPAGEQPAEVANTCTGTWPSGPQATGMPR